MGEGQNSCYPAPSCRLSLTTPKRNGAFNVPKQGARVGLYSASGALRAVLGLRHHTLCGTAPPVRARRAGAQRPCISAPPRARSGGSRPCKSLEDGAVPGSRGRVPAPSRAPQAERSRRGAALCARGRGGVLPARGCLPARAALGLSHNYFRRHAASSFGKEEFGKGCLLSFLFFCVDG